MADFFCHTCGEMWSEGQSCSCNAPSPHVVELEETNARAHAALTKVQQLRTKLARRMDLNPFPGGAMLVIELDDIIAAFQGSSS